jgi:hypothetical protein
MGYWIKVVRITRILPLSLRDSCFSTHQANRQLSSQEI